MNLFWALDRMRASEPGRRPTTASRPVLRRLLAEARAIDDEDRENVRRDGPPRRRLARRPARTAPASSRTATPARSSPAATARHCSPSIFELARRGKRPHVWADETRPLLQGARLTMWELQQRGIDATLICDSVAAQVMREGRIQAVITGADRIAANGDTANKIGTYSVATLARAHGIPFYVAAPTTTFDLSIADGRRDSDRTAGRRRNHPRLRHAKPRPPASTSTIPRSTSRPPS